MAIEGSEVDACMVQQVGHRTRRNQFRSIDAAPTVGANRKGIGRAWRSFQAPIRRSASSSSRALVAYRAAASARGMGFHDPRSYGKDTRTTVQFRPGKWANR